MEIETSLVVQWLIASNAGVEASVPRLGTKIPGLGTMIPCDLQHDQKSTTTIIKYTPCSQLEVRTIYISLVVVLSIICSISMNNG